MTTYCKYRIYATLPGPDPGICLRSAPFPSSFFPPLRSPSLHSSHFFLLPSFPSFTSSSPRSRATLKLLVDVGERCKLPQAESRPKTNLVHSKAVRKPLVFWSAYFTVNLSKHYLTWPKVQMTTRCQYLGWGGVLGWFWHPITAPAYCHGLGDGSP